MLAPDTLLQNRYVIQRLLAQGGMGAVYLAQDRRLNTTFALKETFFTDERMSKAFEREAQLLARLRHPALPKVIDHFAESDGQFLVMEFISGDDLAEMLKQRGEPFALNEVLGWGDQLLDVLDYLHLHEPPIIHRDIKPQNLKLTERGQLILLDFGLAKDTPLRMTRVTSSGSIFGYTPNYAPLEQIQGAGTNACSDLYSLAATLYHLLTGTAPPDALSRVAATVEGQADPLRPANEIALQVPVAVAAVLHKAMALSRNNRYAAAAEMRRELRTAHASFGLASQPAPAPLRREADQARQDLQNAQGRETAGWGQPFNPSPHTSPPQNSTATAQRDPLQMPQRFADAAPHQQVRPPVPNPMMTARSPAMFTQPAQKSRWWLWAVAALALLGAVLAIVLMQRDQGSNSNTSNLAATNSNNLDQKFGNNNAAPGASPGAPGSTPPSMLPPSAAKASDTKAQSKPEKPNSEPSKIASSQPEPPPPEPPRREDAKPEPPLIVRKSGGVLAGSAIQRVEPAYPPLAKAARVTGAVIVEVTVDEAGNVISARAISGHPLLKDAAANAARGWKFTPTQLSGRRVKVIGTITFNFNL